MGENNDQLLECSIRERQRGKVDPGNQKKKNPTSGVSLTDCRSITIERSVESEDEVKGTSHEGWSDGSPPHRRTQRQ